MIRGFKDKSTQSVYEGVRVRQFLGIIDQAVRRLTILDNAETLEDLKSLRSNRFEQLSGDRKNQFSIRINKQWRICFCWAEDGPYDVEILDYH